MELERRSTVAPPQQRLLLSLSLARRPRIEQIKAESRVRQAESAVSIAERRKTRSCCTSGRVPEKER
jgi:hypothetical protein